MYDLTTRQYLDQAVVPVLMQALAECSKEKPKHPISFIIGYLRQNNPENDWPAPKEKEKKEDDKDEKDDKEKKKQPAKKEYVDTMTKQYLPFKKEEKGAKP